VITALEAEGVVAHASLRDCLCHNVLCCVCGQDDDSKATQPYQFYALCYINPPLFVMYISRGIWEQNAETEHRQLLVVSRADSGMLLILLVLGRVLTDCLCVYNIAHQREMRLTTIQQVRGRLFSNVSLGIH